MKKLRLCEYLLFSAIIAGGIFADQITKWLAVKYLSAIKTKPLIEGVLHLTYVENEGAAFGMLADHRWLFMIISSITIVGLGIFLYAGFAQNRLYSVSVAMIISGGIGNMIDRIALGYVVDFIDFCLIDFAVFNGADSFVCVGAGMLILALILDIVKEYKAKQEKQK
jgi:signal peptidase II